MLRLALPLVMAEVGWMTMGLVDTVMVGHLPHPAVTISAVALGQVLYNTLAFGVGGVLLGLDTYISQAHGAGEWGDANKWLLSGVVLAAMLGAAMMAVVWAGPAAMVRMPVERDVMRQAVGFLSALNWGTLPLFLYMTFRRYLQAFNHVRPIAAAVVSANVVNAGLDWLLMFGHRMQVGIALMPHLLLRGVLRHGGEPFLRHGGQAGLVDPDESGAAIGDSAVAGLSQQRYGSHRVRPHAFAAPAPVREHDARR